MKTELQDNGATGPSSPEMLRLEVACALYARGQIGKVGGAQLTGIDFFTFQQALGERGIASYTDEMLDGDLAAIKTLFPT